MLLLDGNYVLIESFDFPNLIGGHAFALYKIYCFPLYRMVERSQMVLMVKVEMARKMVTTLILQPQLMAQMMMMGMVPLLPQMVPICGLHQLNM